MNSAKPIRAAVVGLGRSGYGIHLKALRALPAGLFEPVAVADLDTQRAKTVGDELGVASFSSLTDLLAHSDAELVVVSTFNRDHAKNAIEVLDAGRHVLVEKPFGLSVAEVDAMIAASARAGKVLSPFQNRRFEASYQKVRELVLAKRFGEIVHIRIHQHGFGRRWDWQTLEEFGGGQLHNNGPHILDQALGLLEALGEGDVGALAISADLRNTMSSGDTADHVRVHLTTPSGMTLDIEFLATNPFPPDKWLVCGTLGGLRGGAKLDWKWLDDGALPPRPVDPNPTPDRSYNRESLPWQTDACVCDDSFESLQQVFYTELFDAIRNSAPLPVTPTEARARIHLMERIRNTATSA